MRERLAAEVDRLRPTAREVAWVAPGNFHLTLKFLGQVEAARLPEVRDALARAAAAVAPFGLVLRGLGAFPSLTRPRVIWAGATQGGEAATALAARVDEALGALGFEREARAFAAHVTLGRVRAPRRNPALAAALEAAVARELGRVDVEQVSLMRSELSSMGARYTELAGCRLGVSDARH